VLVWTCPGGSERINVTGFAPNRVETAQCSEGPGVFVEYVEPMQFDPSALNLPALGQAWGAGFTVMGVGLVIAWGFRAVLEALKGL